MAEGDIVDKTYKFKITFSNVAGMGLEGEDVIEKILPKRGRIKRQARPQFVDNSTPEKSATGKTAQNPEYQSNYVIINGQKIENEQEAIDLTKYSFRILSENVSKTVASTEAVNSFINDY